MNKPLPPGRELDAAIAEKVFGWKLYQYFDEAPFEREASTPEDYCRAANNDGWYWSGEGAEGEAWQFKPSTDIASAWSVVEKLNSAPHYMPFYLKSEGMSEYIARFVDSEGEADSAPHAICLAALKAVES